MKSSRKQIHDESDNITIISRKLARLQRMPL